MAGPHNYSVSAETRDMLQKLSKQDRRSVSNMIEVLAAAELERRGKSKGASA